MPGLRNLLLNYLHLFSIETAIAVAYSFFTGGIRHSIFIRIVFSAFCGKSIAWKASL